MAKTQLGRQFNFSTCRDEQRWFSTLFSDRRELGGGDRPCIVVPNQDPSERSTLLASI